MKTMQRRDFLKATALAGLGAACLPWWARGQEAAIPKLAPNGKPWNVLLIAIDDLNDYPSILADYPGVKTPAMDKLSDEALLFTRACTPATSCMPSRAAIMSGLAPWRSGVYGNGPHWDKVAALSSIRSMPQHFRDAGWHTVVAGKVFHEPPTVMPVASARMWDELGTRGGYAPAPKPDPMADLDLPFGKLASYGGKAEEKDIADFQILAETERRLGALYDKPFFIAHGIYYPHVPLTVPQRFLDLYPEENLTFPPPGHKEDDLNDLPPAARKIIDPRGTFEKIKSAGHWKPILRHYLAAVSAADELLGRLVEALNRSPHRDHTILVVFSDHGLHVGEKERFRKHSIWEKTAHVPFMMRVPGVTKPGGVCERVVSLQDIYPTLVDVCGLQEPSHALSGRSIAPLLKEPGREWPHIAITSHKATIHGVRNERFRYITYGGGQEELYDHDQDPHEFTNLASNAKFAGVKKELAAKLDAELSKHQAGR